jgi:hypothetical protein
MLESISVQGQNVQIEVHCLRFMSNEIQRSESFE